MFSGFDNYAYCNSLFLKFFHGRSSDNVGVHNSGHCPSSGFSFCLWCFLLVTLILSVSVLICFKYVFYSSLCSKVLFLIFLKELEYLFNVSIIGYTLFQIQGPRARGFMCIYMMVYDMAFVCLFYLSCNSAIT